jgi:hypothetical protein
MGAFRAAAFTALLLGCAPALKDGSERAPTLDAPKPRPIVSAISGLADAWVIDGTLYGLEPGQPTLVAVDMATATLRFRRALSPSAAPPFQLMSAGPDDVALFANNGAFRYAKEDGHLLDAFETGIAHPTRVKKSNRVCAITNECAGQVIDCESARPIGPVFEGRFVQLEVAGSMMEPCIGTELTPIGRVGSTLYFVNGRFKNVQGVAPEQATSLVAMDAETGTIKFVAGLWSEVDRWTLPGLDPSGEFISFVLTNGDLVSYRTSNGSYVTTESRRPIGSPAGEVKRAPGALLFTSWPCSLLGCARNGRRCS